MCRNRVLNNVRKNCRIVKRRHRLVMLTVSKWRLRCKKLVSNGRLVARLKRLSGFRKLIRWFRVCNRRKDVR